MSDKKANLRPLLFIPLGFSGSVFVFVLSKGSPENLSPEFVVGIVSIIVVVIAAVACLITAILYTRPRHDNW